MTNGNPEEWTLNGELASEAEIDYMEKLAGTLLVGIAAEFYRQYGIFTAAGSIAVFSTQVFEEDFLLGSLASVHIYSGTPDNKKLGVTFAYDNMLSDPLFTLAEDLSEVDSILEDLIEEEGVQPEDLATLQHLKTMVSRRMLGIAPEPIEIMPNPEHPEDFSFVGDVIRSLVENNTSSGVKTRAWELTIGEGHVLRIASMEIIGELSESEDPLAIPRLQIEYEDHSDQVTYTYTRQQDGKTVLDTSIGTEIVEEETTVDIEVDKAIIDFLDSLGGSTPGKQHVDMITRMLTRAHSIASMLDVQNLN